MKFFFNKANKEDNSTAPQKANVMVEICWRISSVIYKKKESLNEFFFNFYNKKKRKTPQHR